MTMSVCDDRAILSAVHSRKVRLLGICRNRIVDYAFLVFCPKNRCKAGTVYHFPVILHLRGSG